MTDSVRPWLDYLRSLGTSQDASSNRAARIDDVMRVRMACGVAAQAVPDGLAAFERILATRKKEPNPQDDPVDAIPNREPLSFDEGGYPNDEEMDRELGESSPPRRDEGPGKPATPGPATRNRVPEWCREDLPNGERCDNPAEFILWGRLFSKEGLGPRCYDHAAKHAGHRALSPGAVGQYAIYVLPHATRNHAAEFVESVLKTYDDVTAGGAGSWDWEVQFGARVKDIVEAYRRG